MLTVSSPRVLPLPRAGKSRANLGKLIAGKARYLAVHDFSPVDRIEVVRGGVPAGLLTTLAEDMEVPKDRLYRWLGIARATANRKIKAGEVLSQDEGERALGMARLVGQVEKVVAESGDPQGFDAARWTATWLASPNHSLGGKAPGEFLDTAEGRVLVSGLIAQMQSGAYA